MAKIFLFVFFRSFLNTITNIEQNLTIKGKSVDGVLGIWSRDCRVVDGADETTELCRFPIFSYAFNSSFLWLNLFHIKMQSIFCLKTIRILKVGIASKYMGPIILSLNYMMKDVLLFLITFTVIMLAFASGVAYIFNMASGNACVQCSFQ